MTTPNSYGVDEESASDIGLTVMLCMKYMHSMRYHVPSVHEAVEPGLYPVMLAVNHGEQRVSDIAEAVMSDVSTVSRQVNHLEANDLLRKIPDPQDRRSKVVTLTVEGKVVIERLHRMRSQWFQYLLKDWPSEDVRVFRELILRFVSELERGQSEAAEADGGLAKLLTDYAATQRANDPEIQSKPAPSAPSPMPVPPEVLTADH